MSYEAFDRQARYSTVAIGLHWAIALLLTANIVLGFFHDSWGRTASAWLMFFHKSIGLSVLALTIFRLLWRLAHRPPPLDDALKRWEAGLARSVHAAFYALLLALPLTGWMFSSSWGRPNPFFGLVEIPALPVPNSDGARTLFGELHEILGFLAIALIGLHVAGALKHHLQGHRHLIGRMAPPLCRD
ncbi:MAG TPA: cytochrome b [Allosphingosinicella sp.]|jgi:cytochrome b561